MEQASFDTMAPLRHQQRTTSRLSTKPTAKRQQPRQQPTLSAKTLHHNYLAYDFAETLSSNHSTSNTPVHLQPTNTNRANCPTDTHSTLRGFLTCSALVAWTIYEQAITKALLAVPTQLHDIAKRAWTVPVLPTMCFAVLYGAALLAIIGTTATAQIIRGTGTEA